LDRLADFPSRQCVVMGMMSFSEKEQSLVSSFYGTPSLTGLTNFLINRVAELPRPF
jgi:hypothetical protein